LSSSVRTESFPAGSGGAPSPPAAGGGRGIDPSPTEEICVFSIALGALAVFPLLLLFRRLDDNTLTSWRWVFYFADPVRVFVFHLLGIAAAYFVSFLSLPQRRPAVFLFTASALTAFLMWSAPEAIIDSSRYFTQAKQFAVYGAGHFFREWGGEVFAWTDLPLVPLVYGLLFRFFGESRVWVQAATTIMFALTAVLTFLIGQRLFSREVGFFGGLLLLGMPYLLTQVPLMLVDVPTMFFSTLSVFLFLLALERGGWTLLGLSSVAIVLALMTKYSAWLYHGTTLAVILAVRLAEEDRLRVLRRGMIVAAASAAIFGACLLLMAGVVEEQLALLGSYQWPGLRRWGESFLSTLFFQTHPFLSLAGVFSLLVAVRRRDPRYLIIAWMWIVIALLQARRIRYAVPAMPMLALMAAYGLQAVGSLRLRRMLVWCTVSFSIVMALAAYLPSLRGMSVANLQLAGAYLDAQEGIRAARIYIAPRESPKINPDVTVALLDLYTAREIFYHDAGVEAPPSEETNRSAYRFTWEYPVPEYYSGGASAGPEAEAIVFIAEGVNEPLPAELRESIGHYGRPKVFSRSSVFRFKTVVTVYLPKREVDAH
jgi:4-amino-4-deoxy-L-arabinose transferase-like glycosyltransferase